MKYALREKRSDIISDMLYYRGLEKPSEIEAFLSPNYETHTHEPFLMKDMDKTVERLYRAVKNNERVVIFSDYDADGIPGAVVLHDALKKIGFLNFENYIPHRHDEGFGLNIKAIEKLAKGADSGVGEDGKNRAKLLITIDCGISNIKEVTRANELGIDVIITDHHLPHGELPPAFSILNPKQNDCNYPEKMLCGSGVIFKLVQAFYKKHGEEFGVKPGWEKWFLDMVGIATLSDMVPLIGENRVFAFYGLKVLRKTARPGLSRLYEKLRIKREDITEDDIGFTITPRINAASRMGEPEQAFRLLATDDETLAGAYADELEHVNNERKGTVASLVKEMRKTLAARDMSDKQVIVFGNPTWRPSLLGLVANTFAEEHGKPVFLWGRDGDNVIKGSARSARSVGSTSVFALMDKAQKTKDIFSEFGGHGASGGFAVREGEIHGLDESLQKAFINLESAGELQVAEPTFADGEISLEEVTWDLYKKIEKLAPFGVGNQKPLFILRGAHILAVKSFGKEGNHTEITLADKKGRKISAIKFFLPTSALPGHITAQSTADLAVHLEKSTFKRYPELRLRIVDIL